MSDLLFLLQLIAVSIPFLLLVLLGNKNNLKKPDRSRQIYMPVIAVIFCIAVGVALSPISDLIVSLITNLSGWIQGLGDWVAGLFGGALAGFGDTIRGWATSLDAFVQELNVPFWAEVLVNLFVVLAYLLIKRIVITVLKRLCKDGVSHYERAAQLLYARHPQTGLYHIKADMQQGVTLLKTLYYAAIALGLIGIAVSAFMLQNGLISSLYYPVFGVIMVGELFFIIDGELPPEEEQSTFFGEDDRAVKICDYTYMRQVLSRNFGDKLLAENTSVNSDMLHFKTNAELLEQLTEDERAAVAAYGNFIRQKVGAGLELDQNYLDSGLQLLLGKSVVFNNPFYYDLMPYAFFAMNRTLLRRKKVLIVLGRHAVENDIIQWCNEGLLSVTPLPSLWEIGVLGSDKTDPDVGIVTRSSVHDLQMHEQHADFFKKVEFVVLLEPSRLIATAQIGLNSLIRYCRRDNKQLVFCSADKNCDGLVDALSHILMTSLEEVSATNKHKGTCSYMCWNADEEHLQHRMLQNLSRYLGMGTELSFAALKNQISRTEWYGGDAFPVRDMHWIAKQYYYDLLRFASLPTVQSTFDEVFAVSPNMWSASIRSNAYLTVEDENYNMYEIKRAFSTRSTNQGFVNVISSDYLLKDYMAANDGLFDADSKAIPYFVADYAHTERNVMYRLCLRLTVYPLSEQEIRSELSLLNLDPGEDIRTALWEYICTVAGNNSEIDPKTGRPVLCLRKDNTDYRFDSSVIYCEQKYSFKSGKTEMLYSIDNRCFVDVFLADLCSARYLAEDETEQDRFLGTELRGHIFQKYLPGQFFTFGGKYYEMLYLTADGRVLVRRAADHINGRPQYRQVRTYCLSNVQNSDRMGDCRTVGPLRLIKQNANIQVDTPAYWQMQRYNDFCNGKEVSINGVPTRHYYNKQLLRIDLPEELVQDRRTLDTVALLMNEVFRTMYAENQGMIVAVTAGQAQAPCTYSLQGDDVLSNSLYIIEDSQMDLGFIVSVERNLSRIFSIICDYLEWHTATLSQSLTPPEQPEPPCYVLTDEQRASEQQQEREEKKKKGVRGFFRRIGDFFKRLFKRKKKDSDYDDTDFSDDDGLTEDFDPQQDADQEEPALMNLSAPKYLYRVLADQQPDAPADAPAERTRSPYHQRYYLLYGAAEQPETIDVSGTLDLLRTLGYGKNALEQARTASEVDSFTQSSGGHYCDFCGTELFGSEYEVLTDGRERCMLCSRTAVKTEQEFKQIYQEVLHNLTVFFGINITAPITVQMVNAKKLHKQLNKTFVPSAEFDGRVLGVAIRDKRGAYTILLENGSPRLNATMTIVHELTHIWQYLNWNEKQILHLYGKKQNLEVYEGMAKWVEIQYAYLLNEKITARREELLTSMRQDAYGQGFLKYTSVYPLSTGSRLLGETPFTNVQQPL